MGLGNVVEKILAIVLIPVVIFVLLFVVIFIGIPSLILHPIIVKCAQIFKPELGKVISPFSRLMAIENCYSNKDIPCSILITIQVKGHLEVKEFRNKFEENVLQAFNSDGKLMYPELQQNLVPWMGYMFWKSVPNFKLEDHIYVPKDILLESSGKCTNDQLTLYSSDLLKRPWYKTKALWEIIIIHNFIPKNESNLTESECEEEVVERTILLFRLHHALVDGLSAFRLLLRLFEKSAAMDKVATFHKVGSESGLISNVFKSLFNICKAPYELSEFLVKAMENNDWNYYSHEISKSKIRLLKMNLMSMSHLREIRDQHGVGFNSLVLAIITGAVRELSIQIHNKVPNSMMIMLPIQLPGRSDKLENLTSMVYAELPTGEPDPLIRLHKIEKHYKKTASSPTPLAYGLFGRIFGVFPNFLYFPMINNNLGPSLLLTNIPMTPETLTTCGHLIEDVSVSVSLMKQCSIALFFTFVSYNGNARMVMKTAELMVPSDVQDAEIINLFSKQIDLYSTLGNV